MLKVLPLGQLRQAVRIALGDVHILKSFDQESQLILDKCVTERSVIRLKVMQICHSAYLLNVEKQCTRLRASIPA